MRRKNIHLKHYNYKNDGYYFVTICTALKKPLLNDFAEQAERILLSISDKIEGVSIDYYKVMPTHLHVIFILNNSKLALSEIVRRYKALVTKESGVKHFWEWNYYEHVIRDEKALYNIRKYIEENPLKEMIEWKEVYSRINATAT